MSDPSPMPAPGRCIVYADKLFSPSESFIHRAYCAFDRLKPLYIGHELRGPAPEGAEYLLLNDLHGWTGEWGFKQFGAVSKRLASALNAYDPQLIHAHFGKSGAYALPLAKALDIPLAVTYHGGDATKHSNTKQSMIRVYNRRRDQLWREAALLLPVSDFIRGELTAKGCPPEKLHVHRNAVAPEKFSPGDKEHIILFAGRWVEKKGIETLVRALARIPDQLSSWRIQLLGDGPLKPELSKLLSNAGVQAEMPGWINSEDIPEYMARALIACIPSQRARSGDAEGLPMVAIEAQLSGCAVIATRHAGIPEAVIDGETGLLSEEKDDVALAANLTALLQNPDKARSMGQKGRQHAEQNFNLDIQSKKLQDILLSLTQIQTKLRS